MQPVSFDVSGRPKAYGFYDTCHAIDGHLLCKLHEYFRERDLFWKIRWIREETVERTKGE